MLGLKSPEAIGMCWGLILSAFGAAIFLVAYYFPFVALVGIPAALVVALVAHEVRAHKRGR